MPFLKLLLLGLLLIYLWLNRTLFFLWLFHSNSMIVYVCLYACAYYDNEAYLSGEH